MLWEVKAAGDAALKQGLAEEAVRWVERDGGGERDAGRLPSVGRGGGLLPAQRAPVAIGFNQQQRAPVAVGFNQQQRAPVP